MGRPAQLNPNRARVAEQQARAFAMKSAGATYAQIAKELGISVGTAHKRVTDACAEHVVPELEQYRAVTDEAYDRLLRSLAPGVSKGEIPAVDAARRVWADRRKLFGLDAPVRTELQITAQIDKNADEIARVVTAAVTAALDAIDADQWWRGQLTGYAMATAAHELDPEAFPVPEPPKQRLAITAGADQVDRAPAEPPEPPRPVVPRIEVEDTPERQVQRAFDALPPELGGRGGSPMERNIASA